MKLYAATDRPTSSGTALRRDAQLRHKNATFVAATVPALARTEIVRTAPQPEQVNVTTTICGLHSVQESTATRCPQRLGVYCHLLVIGSLFRTPPP